MHTTATTRDLPQYEREEMAERLKALGALAIEDAVARAPRSQQDAAGRTLKIGHGVGKMVRQLLFWEGKGEEHNNRIHKTKREWFESEAGLTESQVKTARVVAAKEGLLAFEEGFRRGDGRPTTFYRLNMLNVARVVAASEAENVERRLQRERRPRRRHQLEEKLAEVRDMLEELDVIGDGSEGAEPDGGWCDDEQVPTIHLIPGALE
jgi:hypothetical protein